MKRFPTALSTTPKSLPDRGFSCVRVALNVPLARLFDYSVPANIDVAIGDRVVVPFGSRQRIGVVVEIDALSELPKSRLKTVLAIRDTAPGLPGDWLALLSFLAAHSQAQLGESVIRALPPRLRSVKPLPRKAIAALAESTSHEFRPAHALTAQQASALSRASESLGRFEAFLLHGITGSGKTEIYLHLIARVLERGGQALVLVPEISLTPQLEGRFRSAFPQARIALMHSALEDVARTTAWLDAARGDAGIILGTRLAVLAPLAKLSLIVVDEEHDSSFKQQEGLRYSARDAAVYRAKLSGCPVALGTA